MPRIRITGLSKESDILAELRQAWVGMELDASGPFFLELESLLNPGVILGKATAYVVPSGMALRALKKKDEKAWEWWSAHCKMPGSVCFVTETCEVIQP